MFDSSLQMAREALEGRRVALVEAIAALDRVLVNGEPPDAVRDIASARPRRGKVKVARRPSAVRAAKKTVRAERVSPFTAREDAIMSLLHRNDGVATSAMLRKAMPKEPDLTEEQRDAAYRNTMSKLKHRGVLGRTGDTWSLVGRGSES